METLQRSTGKKFTAGGGAEEVLCKALSLHRHPAGNSLGRNEEGRTHGDNLKCTECGVWGYRKGGRVFSQRDSEMRRDGKMGKGVPVNRSWEHVNSMATNVTSWGIWEGKHPSPPPAHLPQRVPIFKTGLKCYSNEMGHSPF